MVARWMLGRRRTMLIGAAAIAGAIAGVYVSLTIYGKNQPSVAAECTETPTTVTRVEPFVTGEVAAFRLAKSPENLSEIAFTAPNGAATALGDFAGRTILVNLWATWCVPCRTEMPTLDALQKTLGSDRFEVVAINIDLGDQERARAFLEEIGAGGLDFYSDATAGVFNDLKRRGLAFGLPVTLLLDDKGCRIGSLDGPAEWDSEDAKALIGAAVGTS